MKIKKTHPQAANYLASQFAYVLNTWLLPNQLVSINEINQMNKGEDSCASHNFCDPNQAIIDAWNEIFDEECNIGLAPECKEDMELINAAWTIAKDGQFLAVGYTQLMKFIYGFDYCAFREATDVNGKPTKIIDFFLDLEECRQDLEEDIKDMRSSGEWVIAKVLIKEGRAKAYTLNTWDLIVDEVFRGYGD